MVYKWKRQLCENVSRAFEAEGSNGDASGREDELLKKIGELTVERDCLAGGLESTPMKVRRAFVQPDQSLSMRRQCEILAVNRIEPVL